MTKTVAKSLKILTLLKDHPMTCSEIGRALGIDRSSANRTLQTLCHYGFVKKTGAKYKIGLAVVPLAQSYLEHSELHTEYQDIMRELHEFTQETVHLTELAGNSLVCIGKIESKFPLRVVTKIGGTVPFWSGAAGKAFLAALPYSKLQDLFHKQKNEGSEELDFSSLLADLEKVRQQGGVAICYGEINEGTTCLSIPVFGLDSMPRGAVTVVGASARLNDQRIKETAAKLLQMKKQMNLNWEKAN